MSAFTANDIMIVGIVYWKRKTREEESEMRNGFSVVVASLLGFS